MIFWTFLGTSVSVNIGRSTMMHYKASKIMNIKDDALKVSTLKIW